jgi:altronate dehydratase
MRHAAARQQWGITAAAAPGTLPAVTNGWLAGGGGGTWVVNSIGVISRAGHQVLVAVLSDGQPTESAGMSQVEAAVRAAISAITGGSAAGAAGAYPARGSGGT